MSHTLDGFQCQSSIVLRLLPSHCISCMNFTILHLNLFTDFKPCMTFCLAFDILDVLYNWTQAQLLTQSEPETVLVEHVWTVWFQAASLDSIHLGQNSYRHNSYSVHRVRVISCRTTMFSGANNMMINGGTFNAVYPSTKSSNEKGTSQLFIFFLRRLQS